MLFENPFWDPQQTTYHSSIGILIRSVTKYWELSTSMWNCAMNTIYTFQNHHVFKNIYKVHITFQKVLANHSVTCASFCFVFWGQNKVWHHSISSKTDYDWVLEFHQMFSFVPCHSNLFHGLYFLSYVFANTLFTPNLSDPHNKANQSQHLVQWSWSSSILYIHLLASSKTWFRGIVGMPLEHV